jgi:hypothetical protein
MHPVFSHSKIYRTAKVKHISWVITEEYQVLANISFFAMIPFPSGIIWNFLANYNIDIISNIL